MQLLQRGFEISENNRIQRIIASGEDWEIYTTSLGCHALAVKAALYEKWIKEFELTKELFNSTPNCYFIGSSGDYMISSLNQGPFPSNVGQIDAFSVTFKTAVDRFPAIDFSEAIYLEEYALIVPTTFVKKNTDNAVIYGKWITGGIEISIASTERISKIMTWLPQERLARSASMAGFHVMTECASQEKSGQEIPEEIKKAQQGIHVPTFPQDRFTLPGRTELEQFFNDHIVDIVLHQEQYARMGISFPGATVLYGPPGCGKTFAVEKLAAYLNWPQFIIDSSTIGSSFIHDTSKKIAEIFKAAMEAAPSIIVIDEMEAFLSDRSGSNVTGTHHVEEVAEFLRRIPEATAKGVLVFAMTNLIDSIDPAILRRGRFDHIVEVKMASKEEISLLLQTKMSDLPVDDTVDISFIAGQLAGRPLSDVTFVLREAGRAAVKADIDKINQDCFLEALNQLPKKKERRKVGF